MISGLGQLELVEFGPRLGFNVESNMSGTLLGNQRSRETMHLDWASVWKARCKEVKWKCMISGLGQRELAENDLRLGRYAQPSVRKSYGEFGISDLEQREIVKILTWTWPQYGKQAVWTSYLNQ